MNGKKTFMLFVLMVFGHTLMAQKQAARWYFGNKAGLDFNSGTPVALTDGALNTIEGCATISDSNGDLLFYTDGITVWNRNHQPMVNGTGLAGHPSSTQSGMIVPWPNNPDLYYVFTADEAGDPNGLQYNIIDLSLDGGLGAVALKNQLLETPITEKLTAVTHANGIDIWVIAHKLNSNEYISYLITPVGLNTTPVVSAIGMVLSGSDDARGYMKVSPNGEFLALVKMANEGFDLFRFDTATGVLSDYLNIVPFFSQFTQFSYMQLYGLEFSPDSQLVYTSNLNNGIHQFDLFSYNAADVINSGIQVADTGIAQEMGGMQLAIDGKIYVTQYPMNYLGAINNPNVKGVGCNYVENAVSLGTGLSNIGLPPFIQSYFLISFTANNFCLGDTTEFNITLNEPALSVLWDFGDGTTSTLENPTHTYAAPGDYTVDLTVQTALETKNEVKVISISETPVANTVIDFEVCSIDPNPVVDLSTKDIEVLGGQSPLVYELEYYPTLTDAEDRTNVLPLNYTNTDAVETVYVRIHNEDNKECYDITSFELRVKAAPELNAATDWTVCDTDADGLFTFDLSQKDVEIYNGQDSGVFSIAFFSTQADADANTNPIDPAYTNTVPLEDIFFRTYNTTNPECYETGSFKIEVIAGVMANTPTDLEACDDDNDGIQVFDLSLAENEIIGTQNPASLDITYHPSLLDAENGSNTLSMNYSNVVPYNEAIYVRVANTADTSCYDTTSFELRVYDTPVVQQVSDWQVCDAGNDGMETFDLSENDIEILGGQFATDYAISYYTSQANADAGLNALTALYNNTSNPQQIFYRLENEIHTDCYVTGSFDLELFTVPTAGIPTSLIVCDTNETGRQTFDLLTKDAEVLNGLDANDFDIVYFENLADAHANINPLSKRSYGNSATQETIYARIHNKGMESCYDISNFDLIINPLPQPNLDTTYVICPDSPDLVIDGGDFGSWSWQDENNTILGTSRNIDIMALGEYTLTVTQTQNGIVCEKTVAFEVVSSGAPESFTTEIIGFSDTVTLEIDATGFGDFEYSVDGIDFQSNPRFEVFPGEHTVYVRDLFLCRTLSKEIIALGYQKFFTPNGDGNNEYWNVIGAEKYPESSLFIYDRYGKLVKQIVAAGQGWDGTYNGAPLPASDYWFRYVYDQGKIFTGHFSLKR